MGREFPKAKPRRNKDAPDAKVVSVSYMSSTQSEAFGNFKNSTRISPTAREFSRKTVLSKYGASHSA